MRIKVHWKSNPTPSWTRQVLSSSYIFSTAASYNLGKRNWFLIKGGAELDPVGNSLGSKKESALNQNAYNLSGPSTLPKKKKTSPEILFSHESITGK